MPEAVALLLDAGCDIEIKNKSQATGTVGGTALHCVAFWGHIQIARALIQAGADVNAKAAQDVTPLHEAVRLGNFQIAELLLNHGADPEAKDQSGKTPLAWASQESQAKEFKALIRKY